MDFFEHQDRARSRTTLLVLLFALTLVAITISTYLIVAVALQQSGDARGFEWWDPLRFLLVAAGVVTMVLTASLIRTGQLGGNGGKVARMLGGSRLQPGTLDLDEQRALHVVEEMAIASGTPVPEVYVLQDERAINAFVAGTRPGNTAVALTRGAIEKLSRDELQGVVAHEFSHAFHGDMRLNLRLMGWLYGILVLFHLGRILLRSGSGRRSGSKNEGGGQIALVGLGLVVVGGLGWFFARLIQAAISRQREFLADASAVQYTRSVDGIAGALEKLRGRGRSRLSAAQAGEVSHMLFAQGLKSLFATHPPIEVRLRRLGSVPVPRAGEDRPARVRPRSAPDRTAGALGFLAALDEAGQPRPEHLERARDLLAAVPVRLREAFESTWSARAAVWALLLDPDPVLRERQLAALDARLEPDLLAETRTLGELARGLDPAARLPLLDLAVPVLSEQSPPQKAEFLARVDELARIDGELSLFEWMLARTLRRHLSEGSVDRPRRIAARGSARDLECLLGALARAGNPDREARRTALRAAGQHLDLVLEHLAEREDSLADLDGALARLAARPPRQRRRLLEACALVVHADRHVTVEEAELLRAVAEALEVPVPPVLAGAAAHAGAAASE